MRSCSRAIASDYCWWLKDTAIISNWLISVCLLASSRANHFQNWTWFGFSTNLKIHPPDLDGESTLEQYLKFGVI
jgi:hypothetical protein